MIMVIGGAYQGKREFAQEKFKLDPSRMEDGAHASLIKLMKAQSVCNYHTFIASCLQSDMDPIAITEQLIEKNPGLVIISDEVGYGIVPTDPFERAWREAVGRTSTLIASASSEVWRVMSGVGVRIKGDD